MKKLVSRDEILGELDETTKYQVLVERESLARFSGAATSAAPAPMSECEACGALFTEGISGVDGRCALELRTIEIWGRAYAHLVPRVTVERPKTWRVVNYGD